MKHVDLTKFSTLNELLDAIENAMEADADKMLVLSARGYLLGTLVGPEVLRQAVAERALELRDADLKTE